jgi:hypothetical protein
MTGFTMYRGIDRYGCSGVHPHAPAHTPLTEAATCIKSCSRLACRRGSTLATGTPCSSGRGGVQGARRIPCRRYGHRCLPGGNIHDAELRVMRGRGGRRRKTIRRQLQELVHRTNRIAHTVHTGWLRVVVCGRQLLLQHPCSRAGLPAYTARVRRCAWVLVLKAAIWHLNVCVSADVCCVSAYCYTYRNREVNMKLRMYT